MQADPSPSLHFRARLQALLAERGVSQRQLAIDTGLSQQAVNKYVRGVTKLPGAEELLALARYFGVPMESFLSATLSTGDEASPAPSSAPMTEVRREAERIRLAAEELRAASERLKRLGGDDPG